MPLLAPAPHHDVLHVLVAFTILLVAARGTAELASRIGQPPVVGEIIAGLVLGPSLISGLLPAAGEWIVPASPVAGHLLEFVGSLGAVFLLILTGIETDVVLIRRNLRTAASVAAGGLLLPFALGYAVTFFIADDLLADPSRRPIFALFLATAMAVSAIPVVAKVLLDLGLIRRRFGQTVLAAGMIDDTVAWVMLSIVLALAAGDSDGLATALAAGRIVLFLAVAATLGKRVVNWLLVTTQDRGRSADRVFTVVIATALGFGAIAQSLGIEAVLGAFVAGIILGQNPRLPVDVVRRLHTMALAVFAPVFFAIAGLKVDIRSLAQPRLVVLTFVILVIAVAGKLAGAYVGARLVGVDTWTSAAYGSALNARGAVGIIIASIGLTIGILSAELYAIVVLVAVVTSVMTPLLVRYFLSKAAPDPEDDSRATRARAEASGISHPRRVLIPVRPGPGSAEVHRLKAGIVRGFGASTAVTLLAVCTKEGRAEADRFVARLAPMFGPNTTPRAVVANDPVTAILDIAADDYDLMMLGAPQLLSGRDDLFNPIVDAVARLAPCPTLILTGRELTDVAWPPQRILLPTDGTATARRAAQLAFALDGEAEISVVHVVVESPHPRIEASESLLAGRFADAQRVVEDSAALALAYGRTVQTELATGPVVADAIVSKAEQMNADLVVLGVNLRPGTRRLHFGPQVEAILRHSTCPVLLLNVP